MMEILNLFNEPQWVIDLVKKATLYARLKEKIGKYEIMTAYYGLFILDTPNAFLVPKYMPWKEGDIEGIIKVYYGFKIPKNSEQAKVFDKYQKDNELPLNPDEIEEDEKILQKINPPIDWDGSLEFINFKKVKEDDKYYYIVITLASVFD